VPAGWSRGTARISHHAPETPQGPFTVWAEIDVDCVVTGGRTATVTGRVIKADPQSQRNGWVGQRFGFSVADNGRGRFDRVGWSGPRNEEAGEPELRPCMAPAPFYTVRAGGYTVKDAGFPN
jgi:hypothetical protein